MDELPEFTNSSTKTAQIVDELPEFTNSSTKTAQIVDEAPERRAVNLFQAVGGGDSAAAVVKVDDHIAVVAHTQFLHVGELAKAVAMRGVCAMEAVPARSTAARMIISSLFHIEFYVEMLLGMAIVGSMCRGVFVLIPVSGKGPAVVAGVKVELFLVVFGV